jgi:hypothetical protein
MTGNLYVVGRHVGFYDLMNLRERQPEKKVIDVSFLEIGTDPKLEEINVLEYKATRWVSWHAEHSQEINLRQDSFLV